MSEFILATGRASMSCTPIKSVSDRLCELSLLAADVRLLGVSGAASAITRLHLSVRPLVRLAVRAGRWRLVLFLPPAVADLPDGVRLFLPADRHAARQLDPRSDPAAVDRRGARIWRRSWPTWNSATSMPRAITRSSLTSARSAIRRKPGRGAQSIHTGVTDDRSPAPTGRTAHSVPSRRSARPADLRGVRGHQHRDAAPGRGRQAGGVAGLASCRSVPGAICAPCTTSARRCSRRADGDTIVFFDFFNIGTHALHAGDRHQRRDLRRQHQHRRSSRRSRRRAPSPTRRAPSVGLTQYGSQYVQIVAQPDQWLFDLGRHDFLQRRAVRFPGARHHADCRFRAPRSRIMRGGSGSPTGRPSPSAHRAR